MFRRKKRAHGVTLDIAREELRRAQEREHHVNRVVSKTSRILEANHLAPKIRNALR